MVGIFRNHQDKGLDKRLAVSAEINLQVALDVLMNTESTVQFFPVQLILGIFLWAEVLAGDDRRDFDILTVIQGMGQGILVCLVFQIFFSCCADFRFWREWRPK